MEKILCAERAGCASNAGLVGSGFGAFATGLLRLPIVFL
jgi:hypothetical protein